ncbi:hypothetical protein [Phenylobacterium sp.]|uniref:hypothetical protein n=1 Tax=Phenylobacterium sp. TaxID=1871053 RepID=UPI00262B1DF6|nr:hypothetical protein [Phenylobacterium sp.]
MTEIEGLIERLEKATGGDRELDLDIAQQFGWTNTGPNFLGSGIRADLIGFAPSTAMFAAIPACTTSLDAALALVERVRPGWRFSCGDDHDDTDQPCWARVFPAPREQHRGSGNWHGATPAIALLISLLRTLEPNNG